jgi:hypothetical protein
VTFEGDHDSERDRGELEARGNATAKVSCWGEWRDDVATLWLGKFPRLTFPDVEILQVVSLSFPCFSYVPLTIPQFCFSLPLPPSPSRRQS